MEHSFTWFSLLFPESLGHVVTAIFVVLLLGALSLRAKKALEQSSSLIPDSGPSLANIFEVAMEAVVGLIQSIIGHHAEKYLPLIGTLFLFIFTCNILGIIPGFLPPTDNINTNAACALTVFAMYNYYGFREHGIKYLKQFTGPIFWLAPLMFFIEIFSHLFRPFSLSVRLFGNIFGDHLVLSIFSDLVPLIVPIAFMILGIAVSLIQAFVFSLLSSVYIALAVSHDH
ncbi:MAG: F0F1 ATP synthase subunit A [Candidatus Tectomicrobia bacterium]|uniref:ATP synthase subunit a n=1 Tax=Tectimicrobiota bacterium TaxID=2528274 RepID=A0A932CLT0_UNCTE|nr:F0F1 ATP synthase subunit A [Candidatus Tectomicrobia bacterium]